MFSQGGTLAYFTQNPVSCHLCHEATDDVGTWEPADPSGPGAWPEVPPFLAAWAPPSYTLAVRDAEFPGNTPPRDKTQQLLFISHKALVTQPFPAATS